ncbi:hypothetical protein ACLOJK_000561 [Asimina triloba]
MVNASEAVGRRSSMRSPEGIEGLANGSLRAGSLRAASLWSASKHMFPRSDSVFSVSGGNARRGDEDEQDLWWAALERLPTYSRLTVSILTAGQSKSGRIVHNQVAVKDVGLEIRQDLLDRLVPITEHDNEYFVQKLRERIDRVEITLPEVEVRYENLTVNANVYVGGRAMPTLPNAALNAIESFMPFKSNKKPVTILKNVSGIIRPGRMTLLLGPPGSGKTTLLLALAGKLGKDLKVWGDVTYNGCKMHEFVPQRTSAYISQHDLHIGAMTVRETMDFSARCQGVGHRHDVITELSRREKNESIRPDLDIDFFMKAAAAEGQNSSIVTDYTLKLLGLDVCADTMVGDEMRRGISGGQKKRVTTGEMMVGPSTALFMDEISTGLDSSTTFQIVKCLKQIVHGFRSTIVISLLQPAPETFNIFDDVVLICEGQIVYHGPRDSILEFFEMMGFRCPERKGVADFLQEVLPLTQSVVIHPSPLSVVDLLLCDTKIQVTSRKDQQQYWFDRKTPYRYITVDEFSEAFKSFHVGNDLFLQLVVPYDRSRGHPAALIKKPYGLSKKELFKACFDREVLMMKRNAFVYVFKSIQIMMVAIVAMTVFIRTQTDPKSPDDMTKFMGILFFGLVNNMFNGLAELQMTIVRLPVFYKQRDAKFFPAWAFALATFIMRMPISLLESSVWVILTYYTCGLTPSFGRCVFMH